MIRLKVSTQASDDIIVRQTSLDLAPVVYSQVGVLAQYKPNLLLVGIDDWHDEFGDQSFLSHPAVELLRVEIVVVQPGCENGYKEAVIVGTALDQAAYTG